MNITRLTLTTTKLEEMKLFYEEIMGFPIIMQSEKDFSLQAGSTVITFEKSLNQPFYHYAFKVNTVTRLQMMERIKKCNIILGDQDGTTDFFSQNWKTEQVYFTDPEGNVVELLTDDEQSDTRVVEVGMPVNEINQVVKQLDALDNNFVQESDTFSFLGNKEGVFVLVKSGRPWFPTNIPAKSEPAVIYITDVVNQTYIIENYKIICQKEVD